MWRIATRRTSELWTPVRRACASRQISRMATAWPGCWTRLGTSGGLGIRWPDRRPEMTAEEFRELALALPGVEEREHMRHPDFRAHGRIFATLAYPNEEWGVVKLSPADQQRMVSQHGQA